MNVSAIFAIVPSPLSDSSVAQDCHLDMDAYSAPLLESPASVGAVLSQKLAHCEQLRHLTRDVAA